MIEKTTVLLDDDFETDELEEDEKRIADILVPGKKIENLPNVSLEMLKKYYRYLSQKLPSGLLIKGRETLGYFSWEEKFDFGFGSEEEYDKFKKHNASCYDKLKLIKLEGIDPDHGIIATVSRLTDNKKFNIPLEDLEACDESSEEYMLLEDYSMWFVNYNGNWI